MVETVRPSYGRHDATSPTQLNRPLWVGRRASSRPGADARDRPLDRWNSRTLRSRKLENSIGVADAARDAWSPWTRTGEVLLAMVDIVRDVPGAVEYKVGPSDRPEAAGSRPASARSSQPGVRTPPSPFAPAASRDIYEAGSTLNLSCGRRSRQLCGARQAQRMFDTETVRERPSGGRSRRRRACNRSGPTCSSARRTSA